MSQWLNEEPFADRRPSPPGRRFVSVRTIIRPSAVPPKHRSLWDSRRLWRPNKTFTRQLSLHHHLCPSSSNSNLAPAELWGRASFCDPVGALLADSPPARRSIAGVLTAAGPASIALPILAVSAAQPGVRHWRCTPPADGATRPTRLHRPSTSTRRHATGPLARGSQNGGRCGVLSIVCCRYRSGFSARQWRHAKDRATSATAPRRRRRRCRCGRRDVLWSGYGCQIRSESASTAAVAARRWPWPRRDDGRSLGDASHFLPTAIPTSGGGGGDDGDGDENASTAPAPPLPRPAGRHPPATFTLIRVERRGAERC